MKILVLLIALLAIGVPVRAQQIGLIANTYGRKTVSLNGQWQTIIDPYESGYYNYRYQPSDNGYFKKAKPKSKCDLLATPPASENPGLLEPQRTDFESRQEEESVLRVTAVVSRVAAVTLTSAE